MDDVVNGGSADAAAADQAPPVKIGDVQRSVCEHFRVHMSALTSPDRSKSVTFARHVAMYLCRKHTRASLPDIGKAFGGRDHTTVLSAVRQIGEQNGAGSHVSAQIKAVERILDNRPVVPPADAVHEHGSKKSRVYVLWYMGVAGESSGAKEYSISLRAYSAEDALVQLDVLAKHCGLPGVVNFLGHPLALGYYRGATKIEPAD
jgi:hypothetical protein